MLTKLYSGKNIFYHYTTICEGVLAYYLSQKGDSMFTFIMWVIALIYCAVPVDLFPGPIDDAIILFVVSGITYFTSHKIRK